MYIIQPVTLRETIFAKSSITTVLYHPVLQFLHNEIKLLLIYILVYKLENAAFFGDDTYML